MLKSAEIKELFVQFENAFAEMRQAIIFVETIKNNVAFLRNVVFERDISLSTELISLTG